MRQQADEMPTVVTVAQNLDDFALNSRVLSSDFITSSESMTALNRVIGVVQTTLRFALVIYSLCISGIFALFANRRAEGNIPLSVLFVSTSLFYNVFGALMFGKRVGNFLSESYKRAKQCDGIYLSLWFLSLGLAGMTAMAGVKISEDSVQVLEHQALIKTAVSMFVFNTLSTRWAGGLDLLEKVYKEIRYRHFDRFLQDWKKYDGALLTAGFSSNENKDVSHHEQLITHFYEKLAENHLSLSIIEELKFYSDKIVKSFSGLVSILLFPMWISLTANGLKAIDPAFEKSAPFTISCAWSNLPFYFISCFNLLPNSKLLLSLLAEKLNPEATNIRHFALGIGFMFFVALSIVSGGGYAMEVKDMVKNGYGRTAHDIVPDAFFDLTNSFASYFAMVIAGLVNFANTAKFFADVLSVQKNNPTISFVRAMGIYMNFADVPAVLPVQQAERASDILMPAEQGGEVVRFGGDGLSNEQLQAYTEEQKNQMVEEMRSALSKNQFHEADRSVLSVGEQAVKITSDAIKTGREKWSSATSWCASWFRSNSPVVVEVALAESLVSSSLNRYGKSPS